MRTLYLTGLAVLDVVVLGLGAALLATMDLDKAGTLGVIASVPVLLLVLSDFPVAHIALRQADARPHDAEDPRDLRATVLLATALTLAGAVPLLLLTAAADGPVPLAIGCSALGVFALVYAFGVGDRLARRRPGWRILGDATLVRRGSPLPAGRALLRLRPRASAPSARSAGAQRPLHPTPKRRWIAPENR